MNTYMYNKAYRMLNYLQGYINDEEFKKIIERAKMRLEEI